MITVGVGMVSDNYVCILSPALCYIGMKVEGNGNLHPDRRASLREVDQVTLGVKHALYSHCTVQRKVYAVDPLLLVTSSMIKFLILV